MARTFTSTSTFARLKLVELQVRRIIRQTCNPSESTLERLMRGVREKWLSGFSVAGYDARDYCHVELEITLDWEEHHIQIDMGRTTVTVDTRWRDNIAVEIDEAIQLFNTIVDEKNLHAEWRVWFTREVDQDESLKKHVRERLGTTPAAPKKWAGERDKLSLSIDKLPEILIDFTVAG